MQQTTQFASQLFRRPLSALSLLFIASRIISCSDNTTPANNLSAPRTDTIIAVKDTLAPVTALLQESINETDTPSNETYINAVAPIRAHFKYINAVVQWDSTGHQELEDVSTDGGEAKFYYTKGKLQKIAARYFGESGQSLVEYYILNGKLALVNEEEARYNRPYYYDSTAMKENEDSEAFDPAKTTYSKLRSYFIKDKLLYQFNFEDCGAPNSDSFLLAEQQRILPQFHQLLKQSRTP